MQSRGGVNVNTTFASQTVFVSASRSSTLLGTGTAAGHDGGQRVGAPRWRPRCARRDGDRRRAFADGVSRSGACDSGGPRRRDRCEHRQRMGWTLLRLTTTAAICHHHTACDRKGAVLSRRDEAHSTLARHVATSSMVSHYRNHRHRSLHQRSAAHSRVQQRRRRVPSDTPEPGPHCIPLRGPLRRAAPLCGALLVVRALHVCLDAPAHRRTTVSSDREPRDSHGRPAQGAAGGVRRTVDGRTRRRSSIAGRQGCLRICGCNCSVALGGGLCPLGGSHGAWHRRRRAARGAHAPAPLCAQRRTG